MMALIFSLGGLIVWYVGGRDVLGDTMTLGSLMAFLAYLAMFYAPLSTLSQLTTWLTSFLTGCHRVFELLDAPVETKEPHQETELANLKGEIRFENVTFGYERHRPILKDVSFTIEPGQRIGIVGRSGSGKTTLVNLLSRFYDVNQGRVLLDGIDLRDLATPTLRQNVGVVLQEPFLFRGTIFDNLIYGRPQSSLEETVTAARAAQAHDFILRKPLGYDTWVGERGAGLSGGERQRVSIARALLYDPKVLILDEATSSIDTESEQAIQDALRVLVRGRTTLAIAHRLSTLRDSDRIFVFDDGRLTEQGSHTELMTIDGTYARLVKIQTRFARDNQFEAILDAPPAAAAIPVTNETVTTPDEAIDFTPHWLEPGLATFRAGAHDSLDLELANGTVHRGIAAVRCFPATQAENLISLAVSDQDGKEKEVGIVRTLTAWPADVQRLLRTALDRRYLHRRITAIHRITLQHGCLDLAVETEQGPAEFTMRWSQAYVQNFGEHGKVLLDLEDNCYLIANTNALIPSQRELLQRFIYW
jgi:ABC-type multidrug transport system ATPase subunit